MVEIVVKPLEHAKSEVAVTLDVINSISSKPRLKPGSTLIYDFQLNDMVFVTF